MPYKKGQSGNPDGKPKGAKNITTREAKELLNQVMFGELRNIQVALTNLRRDDPGKYLDVLSKLMKYSLPVQTQNEININALTDVELDRLCDSIIQKFNENEKTDE